MQEYYAPHPPALSGSPALLEIQFSLTTVGLMCLHVFNSPVFTGKAPYSNFFLCCVKIMSDDFKNTPFVKVR